MLILDMKYVKLRGKSQRYRRVIPPKLRAKIAAKSDRKDGDLKHWTHTWRKNTPLHIVQRQALALTAQHDREIAIAQGKEIGPAQIEQAESLARELMAGGLHHSYMDMAQGETSLQTEAVISAIAHNGKYVPEAPLLSVALAQDIERYGQDRDNYPVESTVASFISVISDQPVTSISRADAMAWIASLKNADGTPYAPATLRKRVGNMRGLLNRTFLDLEYAGLNPFAKHRLKGNGSVTDKLPFDREMLKRIDAHLAGSTRLKHETKHVLQIMRNTGASPKEIGGLVLADVSLAGAVPYMWIRVNAQRGIKSPARDRQIPLVGVSLEAMKAAVKLAKERTKGESPDKAKLFEGFGGKTGQDAKLISKNINKAVHAADIPEKCRLSAYSSRHTFEEAMRSAGILNHMTDRLMGHTIPGIAGRYGSPRALLAEAREAIEKSLDHQGRVDDSIYSERERMK